MAENLDLKQQLIVHQRKSKRSPKLTTFDRVFFGLVAIHTGPKRIAKYAVILKPSTLLRFHKSLVNKKYHNLFSNKPKAKPGRKPPDTWLIDLVVKMKQKNPSFGYGRIAMQIYHAFGVNISRFTVGRILRKNHDKLPSNDGPSWLSFIGGLKDSLWSVDLFRCESVMLKSHWVMVVIQKKLNRFQEYYNSTRGHSSLSFKTPNLMTNGEKKRKPLINPKKFTWQSYCNGLYQLPAIG